MKNLIIIGASGHGKVVADIASRMNRYEKICFLDDNMSIHSCLGFPVVGATGDYRKFISESDFFVAIGNADVRKKIQEQLLAENACIPTLIHPQAIIGSSVRIGIGTVVMAGAVVNPDVTIGTGCIINTGGSVDHDCVIGDYVHVAVGAHIAGAVSVGDSTWIGAGAIVSNNIHICGHSMIGAGAVVVTDIENEGTYIGVPAKKMR